MRAMRQPAAHEASSTPSLHQHGSFDDLSRCNEGRLEPPCASFAPLAPAPSCSLLVVPKSRTWATTRNDLQDAKQSEVPAGNTVTRRASGVVGGSALQRSMAAGAQAGRTSPRGVCVVIIMTSCVGAVGSDERAHACSASRRFMSLHVYSNY